MYVFLRTNNYRFQCENKYITQKYFNNFVYLFLLSCIVSEEQTKKNQAGFGISAIPFQQQAC